MVYYMTYFEITSAISGKLRATNDNNKVNNTNCIKNKVLP